MTFPKDCRRERKKKLYGTTSGLRKEISSKTLISCVACRITELCVCYNMFCACFKNLSTFYQIFNSDRGGIKGNCIVVQPLILANVQCIK